SIWQYCTEDWARFTAEPLTMRDRKNKNHQRFATSPLWDFVRSVRFDSASVHHLERHKRVNHINVDHLGQMLAGIALTVSSALVRQSSLGDFDAHFDVASKVLFSALQKKYQTDRIEYDRKIKVKRNQAYVCFDYDYHSYHEHERRYHESPS
ncbi:MAG: hypothetical protein D3906_18555, partial [Candidatus Electrothrix sp. AUS1_2]|nr:hypothetical protein [Candidatus Electrothrix sp. AUS1_2]